MAKRRGHGEGTTYQREDGLWVGSLTLGYEGGKRRRKYLYGKTQREVLLKLSPVRHAQQQGVSLLTDERQTLGQYLERWLEDSAKPTIRAKTYASYAQLVRLYLLPELGCVQLTRLTPRDVQAFLNRRLEAGLSARTVQYTHAVLRRALNQALKWGLVQRNVAALVDAPRVRRPEAKYLAPEQALTFIDSVRGDRLEAAYVVAILLGLRPGETLGLRWTAIDLEAVTLSVQVGLQRVEGKLELVETKTLRSRRTVPLPALVSAALHAHRVRQLEERLAAGDLWQDTGLVFTNVQGKPLAEEWVSKCFHKALTRAGLPSVRLYDLRHTCASLLLVLGVPMRVVMEILGHSQISMTANTYTHVIPQLERDAADRLDAFFATTTTAAAGKVSTAHA